MVAEELRTPGAALRLDLLEEISHGAGIEAGVVHNIGAEQIGFGFRLPRVLQEVGAETKAKSLCAICESAPCPITPPSIASGSCAAICLLAARVPWRCTTLGDLVRHYACEFSFVIRHLDRPHIHEDRPSGQSKCVDLFLIHYVKRVRPLLARSMGRQLLPQALHVDRNWV